MQIDRVAASTAEAVCQFRLANRLRGNEAMKMAAAARDPLVLAKIADRRTINKARQYQLEEAIACGEPDPRLHRDDITLVSIPLGRGKRRQLRMNRKLVKLILFGAGLFVYWLAKKIGVPLRAIE